ncbi:hypothetical protein Ctob_003180, partial [Chrysochromulina tobinii]
QTYSPLRSASSGTHSRGTHHSRATSARVDARAILSIAFHRRLENGGRGRAAQATRRVKGVDTEELVDQAAGDAHHRRAAVLALNVKLESLRRRVVVAHPGLAANVAGLALGVLRLEEEVARLHHASDRHDLQPGRRGERLERLEAAAGDIGELEARRRGQVAREARAALDQDDMEEAHHGRAAVLDLHNLVALHVARRDEAQRVKDAQRREDANVALLEAHGGAHGARRGLEGRHLEGGGLEGESGNHFDGDERSKGHGGALLCWRFRSVT